MNHKKINKPISAVIVGAIILSCLIGCSSLKDLVSWISPSDSKEENPHGFTENELSQFIAGVRPHQGNPDSHYMLGCYHQERGRHAEAIDEFKKAILIDPMYVNAYNGMGVSYDLLGNFSDSVAAYKKALYFNRDLDYVQNNLGYSYLLQGNFDSAIDALQKAIALNDRNKRYHNNLALAYAEKGYLDLAFAELKLAVGETRAYQKLAQLCYKKGLYKEGNRYIAKALAMNSSREHAEPSFATGEPRARVERRKIGGSPPGLSLPPLHELTEGSYQQEEGVAAVGTAPEAGNNTEGQEPVYRTVIFVPTRSRNAPDDSQEEIHASQQHSEDMVSIEVLNGNGVTRMATRVGNYLAEKGFQVLSRKNAAHFDYEKTRIYYFNGYLQDAYRVARHIPGYQNMESVMEFEDPAVKIRVLIGKDLIQFNRLFT
jgi:tetratricopeptide (TPR) repeat protein